MDIMLDLETVGTEPGCVIVSMAARSFVPGRGTDAAGASFETTLEIEAQTKRGLVLEGGSFEWWLVQSREAFEDSFSLQKHPVHAFMEFNEFWNTEGGLVLWAQGQDFDGPILRKAMQHCDIKPAWMFYQQRDTRTFYDVARMRGGFNYRSVPRLSTTGVAHSAMADVNHQIHCMAEAWPYITGEKK